MKNKSLLIVSILSFVLFGLLIVLLKTVDVAATGIEDTVVGLSSINLYFRDLIGNNLAFYHITGWVGIISFVVAFGFVAVGIVQLIMRKSLLKVDVEILFLGILYVVIFIVYFLFEKVIVNYRPILLGKGPEASFPSSHTLIAITVMVTAVPLIKKYFADKNALRNIIIAFLLVVMGVTVVGRIISGVHWITDIFGGILLSVALITGYLFAIKTVKEKRETPTL